MIRYSLIIACVLTSLLFSQEFQGTLLGRITDPSGALVPDVLVTVINSETGASSHTKTNSQGNYRVPFLLPGDYTVQVGHPGFQKLEHRNVRLSTATETTLNIVLQVATTSEAVTVNAVGTAMRSLRLGVELAEPVEVVEGESAAAIRAQQVTTPNASQGGRRIIGPGSTTRPTISSAGFVTFSNHLR